MIVYNIKDGFDSLLKGVKQMSPKKCEVKKELPIKEQLIRAIVASRNRTIVNVNYETHENVTVINID